MRKDCGRVLKKSHFAENAFPSFSLVFSFSLPLTPSVSLSYVCFSSRGKNYFWKASGPRKSRALDTSLSTTSVICRMRQWIRFPVYTRWYPSTHTHTYAYACRCIYRDKPAPFRSFDKSGPRSADFLRASPLASSVWDTQYSGVIRINLQNMSSRRICRASDRDAILNARSWCFNNDATSNSRNSVLSMKR